MYTGNLSQNYFYNNILRFKLYNTTLNDLYFAYLVINSETSTNSEISTICFFLNQVEGSRENKNARNQESFNPPPNINHFLSVPKAI